MQLYPLLSICAAGIGVFAGRAFKKDEVVLRSWMTLFLPKSFPRRQDAWYYLIGHNETHMALPLDYGSLINHHECANTRMIGFNNIHYQVRRVFRCVNHNVLKNAAYMHICLHTYTTDARTHAHFQGHKRHRGWTGTFSSVWQRGVV